MRKAANILVATAACAALLVGCSKPAPTGQAVASVNGTEITRQQLNDAIQTVNVPPNIDKATAQNAVLGQLVNQELLVQSAKAQGLDKTPAYLTAVQRATDNILVSLLAKKIIGGLQTPSIPEADRYINSNSSRFANRTIYHLDQLRTAATAQGPWLKDMRSMDQIIAKLNGMNQRFVRGAASLDSGTLPPNINAQLNRLAPGAPFVSVQQGQLIASVIVNKEQAPLGGDEARTVATAILKQDGQRNAMLAWLKALNKDAKIKYADGFAAPKDVTVAPPTAETVATDGNAAPAAPPPQAPGQAPEDQPQN